MATLTRQKIVIGGLQHTTQAAGGSGDVVDNSDGKTFLLVTNNSGGSINVTVTAQQTSVNTGTHGTLTVPNNVVAVANGATKLIGPFPKQAYNNASKQLAISYSGTTSVVVAALYIELPSN
jgi:hypothetical protein